MYIYDRPWRPRHRPRVPCGRTRLSSAGGSTAEGVRVCGVQRATVAGCRFRHRLPARCPYAKVPAFGRPAGESPKTRQRAPKDGCDRPPRKAITPTAGRRVFRERTRFTPYTHVRRTHTHLPPLENASRRPVVFFLPSKKNNPPLKSSIPSSKSVSFDDFDDGAGAGRRFAYNNRQRREKIAMVGTRVKGNKSIQIFADFYNPHRLARKNNKH